MFPTTQPGGVFSPAGTSLAINRMGYGAIQLAGPMAWGPPRDRGAALLVLQESVRTGINHIDTSDYYGPHTANEVIWEALYPYDDNLVIATKVGARRGEDKSWPEALSKRELTDAVHSNIRHLGVDVLDLVYLRVGTAHAPNEASIAEPLSVLVELQAKGLIRHIGLSNVSQRQFLEGKALANIVSVQNHYNIAHRGDDLLIDELASQGIAFVPFFPMGGFRPLASPVLDAIAESLGATTRQVALAWLLQRSPNILVIAGTSSVAHLHDNMKAATLELPPDAVEQLNRIGEMGPRGS